MKRNKIFKLIKWAIIVTPIVTSSLICIKAYKKMMQPIPQLKKYNLIEETTQTKQVSEISQEDNKKDVYDDLNDLLSEFESINYSTTS